MKFSRTEDLATLVGNTPPPVKKPVVTGHEGLLPYERTTQMWLGQVGHWHVTAINGRRWVKGPVGRCPDLRRARLQSD